MHPQLAYAVVVQRIEDLQRTAAERHILSRHESAEIAGRQPRWTRGRRRVHSTPRACRAEGQAS